MSQAILDGLATDKIHVAEAMSLRKLVDSHSQKWCTNFSCLSLSALPTLRTLCTHPKKHVSFFCEVVIQGLGDTHHLLSWHPSPHHASDLADVVLAGQGPKVQVDFTLSKTRMINRLSF